MTHPTGNAGPMRQKVTPPGLPAATVRRERLDDLYDAQLARHDTLIVFAGAGSGKSVQAQLYAMRAELPLAWLTLDRYDRSPSRMLSYLAAAIAEFAPEAEAIAEANLSLLPPDEVAVLLAEAIATDAPFVLVLDQLENIAESAESCEALQAFLDFRPGNVKAILMGRTEMHFTVGRWMLQGRAGRIDEHALALTEAEASEMIVAMGADPASTAHRLATSGGWLAGFAFDSVMTADAASSPDFAAYLTVEILDRMSAEQRSFFLDVSVLDAVSLPAAEALHGPRSRSVWPTITSMHLPMTIRPDHAVVFHPCFRDFLRDRLSVELPGRVTELQRRHASLLVDHGHAEEAVELLLAAGLLDDAADAAQLGSAPVLARGDSEVFLRWSKMLGSDRIDARPVLSGAEIRALVGARRMEAARALALGLDRDGRLGRVIDADPDALPHIAWSLLWHPAEAMEILERYDEDDVAKGATYVIGVMSLDVPVQPPRGVTWSDMDRLVSWGLMLQGRVDDLVAMLPSGDEWPPSSPFTTPHPLMGLLWRGDTARAREMFDDVPEHTRQRLHPVLWQYLEAWLLLGENRPMDALIAAERGAVHCRRTADGMRPVFQIVQGAALLALGRTDDASRVLRAAMAATQEDGLIAYAEWASMFLGRALLDSGADDEGREILSKVVMSMRRAGRLMLLPMAAVYLAEAERRAGDVAAAVAAWTTAHEASYETGARWPLEYALASFPLLGDSIGAEGAKEAVPVAAVADHEIPAMVRKVRISPFGDVPDIMIDGVPMHVRRLKILELACLLAQHPGGISRESVQLRLFPDSDRARSGNYFRQVVHNMRHATSITLQRARDNSVTWSDDLDVQADDVVAEMHIEQARRSEGSEKLGHLSAALDLLDGPYLPKSDLDWVTERRYELDVAREDVAGETAALALELGEFSLARRAAEISLSINPYVELSYEILIDANLAEGREPAARSAARRAIESLRGLGVPPSPAMRRHLDRFARR